jgi:phenylalanyl-tRNA synthetase alpha chain
VTLQEFRAACERLAAEGPAAIAAATTVDEWTDARNALVGRTAGRLTELMSALGGLPSADRREAGRLANELKVTLETALTDRRAAIDAQAREHAPRLDLSMPARHAWRGGVHPITQVIDEIGEIFRELGFTIALGPEVETEWYNFGSLNFPPDHPAMDLHDTIYIEGDVLLRTHTSPVQVRTLQLYPPPIRVLIPGNVYRRDFFDASHAPMFAQIEGLAIDDGISFVDLKATLTRFAQRFFGATRTRFRPSYFPFTEPSAEMDVECRICGGVGCAACKGSGWMEILGSGMVHPSVIEAAGVDSEKYTGWAFGMGPGRIAQQRFGIPDIRLLYDSDMRFLQQLAR